MTDSLRVLNPTGDAEVGKIADAKALVEKKARIQFLEKDIANREKLAALNDKEAQDENARREKKTAAAPVASGGVPATGPAFLGNKTFGRIKTMQCLRADVAPPPPPARHELTAWDGVVRGSPAEEYQKQARGGLDAVRGDSWHHQQSVNAQDAIIGEGFGVIIGKLLGLGSKMIGTVRGSIKAVPKPIPEPLPKALPERPLAEPKPKTGPGNGAYVEKPAKPPPNGFKGPDAYKTHGYKGDPMDTPEGRRLVEEFKSQGYSPKDAVDKASDLMETGVNPPLANPTEIGDRLYKVVPEGKMPGANSEFWSTRQEIDSLQGMSRDAIADKLGLPLESQQAPRFDVVEIKATQPTTTFSSQIAPTSQNGWLQDGGKIQTLVTDRGAFAPPVSTGIKLP